MVGRRWSLTGCCRHSSRRVVARSSRGGRNVIILMVPLILTACAQSSGGRRTAVTHRATIKVLSADVFTGVLEAPLGEFERMSGHGVTIHYGTAGAVRNRVQAGEVADVVILPRPMLDECLAQGRIVTGSIVSFARSAVGVGVRKGAPKPDVGSVESVRIALLAATTISYPDPRRGGATGILFTRVLERLGIADVMRGRTRFPAPGEFAVDVVARGEAEIAIAQPMEMLSRSGVELIGLLPPELQDPASFVFAAGVGAAGTEPDASTALVQFLSSPRVAVVLKSKGMDPY